MDNEYVFGQCPMIESNIRLLKDSSSDNLFPLSKLNNVVFKFQIRVHEVINDCR